MSEGKTTSMTRDNETWAWRLGRAVSAGNEQAIHEAAVALETHGTLSDAARDLHVHHGSVMRAIRACPRLRSAWAVGKQRRKARRAHAAMEAAAALYDELRRKLDSVQKDLDAAIAKFYEVYPKLYANQIAGATANMKALSVERDRLNRKMRAKFNEDGTPRGKRK